MMKTNKLNFLIFLLITSFAILLNSCGGNEKSYRPKLLNKQISAISNEISGPLGDYLSIKDIKTEVKYSGMSEGIYGDSWTQIWEIKVNIERNDQTFQGDIKNLNGNATDLIITVLDKNGSPIQNLNPTKTTDGFDLRDQILTLRGGQSGWITFTIEFGDYKEEDVIKNWDRFSLSSQIGYIDESNISSTGSESSVNGLYPFTSERIITLDEISGYSKNDLKIMRNEIFARHGYIFKTDDMKNYFANQTWYKPQFKDVSNLMSELEKKNIDLIKSREPYAPEISNIDNSSDNYESNVSNSSSDCEQFIKDYIAFAESYIKIIKKYKRNPSDMSILNEYTEFMEKASDMQMNAQDCTDPLFAKNIMEINNKIAAALR